MILKHFNQKLVTVLSDLFTISTGILLEQHKNADVWLGLDTIFENSTTWWPISKKNPEFPLVDISGPKFRFILLRRVYLISRIRDLCGLALVSDYWLSTKSDFLDTFLLLGVWDHCKFKSLTIKPSCTSFFSVWCTDFKIVIFEKKITEPLPRSLRSRGHFWGRWG